MHGSCQIVIFPSLHPAADPICYDRSIIAHFFGASSECLEAQAVVETAIRA